MLVRNFIFWLSTKRGVTNAIARRGMKHGFARRFVAGETLAEALTASQELCDQGRNVSLNHLGENVSTEAAAREVCASYIQMVEEMHAKNLAGNISIKLTQLGLDIAPELCQELLTRVLQRAKQLNNFVRVDMEGAPYTQRTLDLVLGLHERFPNCVVVLQSYLYRTPEDVLRANKARVRVRLVKGAYDEPPTVALAKKADVDAKYEAEMRELLLNGVYPAIATHDDRLIEATKLFAREREINPDRFEFQMLYGIRRDLQDRLLREGYRVRIYVPYGTEWYPYLMRRLAERPANLLFIVRSLIRERRAA